MKKLELKHLLGYSKGKNGIKVKINEDGLRNIWDTDEDMTHIQDKYYIKSIDFDLSVLQLVSIIDENYSLDEINLEWISLILRPLSDRLSDTYTLHQKKFGLRNTLDLKTIDYLKLLEWHFDVFNLIPDGLAIDINTLKL